MRRQSADNNSQEIKYDQTTHKFMIQPVNDVLLNNYKGFVQEEMRDAYFVGLQGCISVSGVFIMLRYSPITHRFNHSFRLMLCYPQFSFVESLHRKFLSVLLMDLSILFKYICIIRQSYYFFSTSQISPISQSRAIQIFNNTFVSIFYLSLIIL